MSRRSLKGEWQEGHLAHKNPVVAQRIKSTQKLETD